jgi:hypothetical protein
MFLHVSFWVLGKVGIQSGDTTLRAKKRVERRLIPDTEAVEYSTISVSFNVEVANPFSGHARFFHLDSTV